MLWPWVTAPLVLLGALVVLVALLRALAHEAAALRRSAIALARVAVAIDDLGHEARELEQAVQHLTRR